MRTEVDIIYQDSGAIIFESSFRKFPSIAIQGDTLGLLAVQMQQAHEMIQLNDVDDELLFLIENVTSELNGLNQLYRKYGER